MTYGLPGLLAALGAVTALTTADRITPLAVAVTASVVVLGFVVPPVVDRIRESGRRLPAEEAAGDEPSSRRANDLRDHFAPRGRGVLPSVVRAGSYFTGRTRVLEELSGWMADPGGTSAYVVTGAPGSGKSAVLGRLVTPAGPAPRRASRSRPAADPVRVAVFARARTVEQVAAHIGTALDLPEPGSAGLLAAVRSGTWPRTLVVVDAVDEAADPFRLVAELLEPLASAAPRSGVRLLVGCRRGSADELLRLFGATATVVDLDDPAYFEPADVREYVRVSLLAAPDPDVATPYRDRPALAASVAEAVARRAGGNFLVAQLTALSLMAAGEPVGPADRSWRDTPATVGAAMERYLRDLSDGRWVRDLLLALAWAEGDGLGDARIWAGVATSLGTARYAEQDVSRLLLDTSAVDLLHRAVVEDRPCFRLFHEALAEHLRDRSVGHRAATDVHRLIVDVLLGSVPVRPDGTRDWASADRYVRMHLSSHAAEAGRLDDLLADPGFLAEAEPSRLLAVLPRTTTGRGHRIARTLERVGRQLLVAPAAERVCYLEMAFRMAQDSDLLSRLPRPEGDRPWSVLWADWETLDDGRLFGHHDSYVHGVGCVAVRDEWYVVSASAWTVRAWRWTDGGVLPVGRPGAGSAVVHLVTVPEPDHAVALTLHEDGTLWRTEVDSVAPSRLLHRDVETFGSIVHEGRPVLAVVSGRTLRLLAADGPLPGSDPTTLEEGENVYAVGAVGDRLLCVTLRDRREVRVRDAATGALVGRPFVAPDELADWAPQHEVWSVALGRLGGSPVVVVGTSASGLVATWEPLRGRIVGEVLAGGSGVGCAAFVEAASGPGGTAFWGDSDGDLRLARIGAGAAATVRVAAHDDGIDTVAACRVAGRLVVVTGGRDGAVRAWQADEPGRARSSRQVRDVAVLPSPPGSTDDLVVAIRSQGAGEVLRAADGTVLHTLQAEPGSSLRHVAPLTGAAPGFVTADSRGQVQVWSPESARPVRTFALPTERDVVSLAVADSAGPVLLAGLDDGALCLLDLTTGKPRRPPVRCHEGKFTVLATSGSADTLRFVTTGWDRPDAAAWEVGASQVLRRPLPWPPSPAGGDSAFVGALAAVPSGAGPVVVGVGGWSELYVWDTADGSLVTSTTLRQANEMSLNAVAVAALGGTDVVLCGGYTASLAVVRTLDPLQERHIRVGSPVWFVRTLTGNRVLVFGSRGGMVLHLSDALGAAPGI